MRNGKNGTNESGGRSSMGDVSAASGDSPGDVAFTQNDSDVNNVVNDDGSSLEWPCHDDESSTTPSSSNSEDDDDDDGDSSGGEHLRRYRRFIRGKFVGTASGGRKRQVTYEDVLHVTAAEAIAGRNRSTYMDGSDVDVDREGMRRRGGERDTLLASVVGVRGGVGGAKKRKKCHHFTLYVSFALGALCAVALTLPWNWSSNVFQYGLNRRAFINERAMVVQETVVGVVGGLTEETVPDPPAPGPPRFVIHLGPGKTGSTTLQKDFGAFTKQLEADNYAYLGKRRDPIHTTIVQDTLLKVPCQEQIEWLRLNSNRTNPIDYSVVPCWNKVLRELQVRHEQKRNVLLSEEGFSLQHYETRPGFMEALLQALADWDLSVVAVYRNYEDQLWSAYKMKCRNNNECPSVWPTIREWMEDSDAIHIARPLDRVVPLWKSRGVPVHILNMHSGNHPTTEFFCHTMTDTPESCTFSRNRTKSTHERSIKGDIIPYYTIAVAAEKKGLNVSTMSSKRWVTATRLMKHHQESLNCTLLDLPLTCPSGAELGLLLNKSLSLEEEFMPDPSRLKETHRIDSFWEAAHGEKRFCSIDTDSLLQGATTIGDVMAQMNRTCSESREGIRRQE